MPTLDIGPLRAVARKLDGTDLEYAFTGGSIVNLLLDEPELSPARPTDDVDVIVEVVSTVRYSQIEEKLRSVGFKHDMSEDAPICRWRLGDLIVDIMPTKGEEIGLNTQWFKEALANAIIVEYAHTKLKVLSPSGFLATKYLTFLDRGKGDYLGSHDLEDFLTVIDGREEIVTEVDQSPSALRNYIIEGIKKLQETSDFIDAIPGHLPPDSASQERLPQLMEKLKQIGHL